MITKEELTCEQCLSYKHTSVKMQVTENGIVRFRVECERCGGFSHYITKNDHISYAVKKWLKPVVEAAGIAKLLHNGEITASEQLAHEKIVELLVKAFGDK